MVISFSRLFHLFFPQCSHSRFPFIQCVKCFLSLHSLLSCRISSSLFIYSIIFPLLLPIYLPLASSLSPFMFYQPLSSLLSLFISSLFHLLVRSLFLELCVIPSFIARLSGTSLLCPLTFILRNRISEGFRSRIEGNLVAYIFSEAVHSVCLCPAAGMEEKEARDVAVRDIDSVGTE